MKFKASQVPATRDGGMFWNGWHCVSRFGGKLGGTHIDVSGTLKLVKEEGLGKHNTEMCDKKGDRPDLGC